MMDTSPEYIKMCDCPEIQEGKPQDGVGGRCYKNGIIIEDGGDVYYCLDAYAIRTCESCGNTEDFINSIKSTWLPRQDDLQGMLDLGRYCSSEVGALAWGVWNYCTHTDDGCYPDSMEQLWLAFVMEEKFHKQWDGEGWTLIEE